MAPSSNPAQALTQNPGPLRHKGVSEANLRSCPRALDPPLPQNPPGPPISWITDPINLLPELQPTFLPSLPSVSEPSSQAPLTGHPTPLSASRSHSTYKMKLSRKGSFSAGKHPPTSSLTEPHRAALTCAVQPYTGREPGVPFLSLVECVISEQPSARRSWPQQRADGVGLAEQVPTH